MIFDTLESIIYTYYIVDGYNIVNTLTYGIILGLSVFGVLPFIKKAGVRFEKKFVLSLIPYLFAGGSMRELVDQHLGIYAGLGPYPQNYLFVAPGIYFTMFSVTVGAFVLSRLILKDKYHIGFAGVGLVFALYNLSLIVPNITNWTALVLILLFFFVFAALVYIVGQKWLRFLMIEGNLYVVFAHLLDASATFVGVDFLGFSEKHVLPNFLINNVGSAFIMFPLKLLVVIPAVYYLEKEMSDDVVGRRFIKLVIIAIGLGPAIRDITLAIL